MILGRPEINPEPLAWARRSNITLKPCAMRTVSKKVSSMASSLQCLAASETKKPFESINIYMRAPARA